MRLYKIGNIIVVLILTIIFLSGCTSTEQTTGKLAFQQGDWAKAEQEFLKEVQKNPTNEEAWFYLGASRLRQNRFTEAEEAFIEYRKIGKNSFANEILSEWEKQYDEGFKTYQAGRNEQNPEEKIKLYKKAIDAFRIAYVILPDSEVVLVNISALNEQIAGATVVPHINKGADLLNTNDFTGAIAEFDQAMKFNLEKTNPSYYVLRFNYGLAYLKWGEHMRNELQNTNPDDKSYQEKYRTALPYLEEVTSATDKNDQLRAWELLVQVYANLGMTAEAQNAIAQRDALRQELNK